MTEIVPNAFRVNAEKASFYADSASYDYKSIDLECYKNRRGADNC